MARSQVFTYPDLTDNQYGRVIGSGTIDLTPAFSMQGNIYYGQLRQKTANGDAAEVEACEDNDALLCGEDGGPIRTLAGAPIPNFITNSIFSRLPAFAEQFAEGGPMPPSTALRRIRRHTAHPCRERTRARSQACRTGWLSGRASTVA